MPSSYLLSDKLKSIEGTLELEKEHFAGCGSTCQQLEAEIGESL